MKKISYPLLIVLVVCLGVGANDLINERAQPLKIEGKWLHKKDFGQIWPLAVDSVQMCCKEGKYLFLQTRDRIFAINKAAEVYGRDKGWEVIDKIWVFDPNRPSKKMDLSVIIDEGVKHCENNPNVNHQHTIASYTSY
ncbi:DUF2511 domain-containing protein [Telluribacter humicola]|uniref:DUF2511 domain-containing protein n=1 Tax=Telluribacter humicola TaxID=1720261 RepID=UPI001A960EA6|nr:DUF2511 domain-containing protein [Telluribacter humicola]